MWEGGIGLEDISSSVWEILFEMSIRHPSRDVE